MESNQALNEPHWMLEELQSLAQRESGNSIISLSRTMPSVDDVLLYEVFTKYCNFGSRAGSLTGESPSRKTNITTPLMDGSKFAKLAREANLLDDVITSTEVDILFSRVKDRGERRISFLQFRMALKLLAEKKYRVDSATNEVANVEAAEEQVLAAVRNVKGPQLSSATLPESSDTIERLMDGPATYISKSPNTEPRSWKDGLRRSSSPTSRRSSNTITPGSSRKSSLNPNQLGTSQLPSVDNGSPSKSSFAR